MTGWKLWLGIGAVALVILFGMWTTSQNGPTFIRTPYLGFDGNPATTMVVSWKTGEPATGTVSYAPQAMYTKTGRFTRVVTVSAKSGGKHHVYHATLSGLAPDTRYVYQVKLVAGLKSTMSARGEFWTAATKLDHFTFDVYGDTRTYPARHALVVKAMEKDHPRFVVHTGDLVEFGGVDMLWDGRFFPSVAPLAKDAPYLTVLGNHEQDSPQYYEGFSLPPGGGEENKEWWSMDYGVVHLIGLDTNALMLPNGFTRMRNQISWLKKDLKAAKARGEKFIFVFFHHPLFSSDYSYGPGNTGLRTLWHPIFKEYGVNVVFSGHCHQYERLVEDGVNYIVTGGGGAPLGGFKDTPVPGSVKRASLLHYVRVTVSGDQVRLEMIPVAKVEGNNVIPVPPQPADVLTITGQ